MEGRALDTDERRTETVREMEEEMELTNSIANGLKLWGPRPTQPASLLPLLHLLLLLLFFLPGFHIHPSFDLLLLPSSFTFTIPPPPSPSLIFKPPSSLPLFLALIHVLPYLCAALNSPPPLSRSLLSAPLSRPLPNSRLSLPSPRSPLPPTQDSIKGMEYILSLPLTSSPQFPFDARRPQTEMNWPSGQRYLSR